MKSAGHALELLPGTFAIARLAPDAEVPPWASEGAIASVIRTDAECSIVCAESAVPKTITAERGFKGLRVRGPLPFDAVGVLASLVAPLAEAGISILSLSTYDTDYLLVPSDRLEDALGVLRAAGHTRDAWRSGPGGS